MLRKYIYLFLFSFICTIDNGYCAVEAEEVALINRLYVVHAMHKLPRDGILRAGIVSNGLIKVEGVDIEKGAPVPGVAGWRPTLHFSVGKLADDIPGCGMIISDRPYVVIFPLSHLRDKLIGVSIEDTVILGNLLIPAGSILLATDQEPGDVRSAHPWTAGMNVVKRLSDKRSMEDHVAAQIKGAGGLVAPTAKGMIANLCPKFAREDFEESVRRADRPYVCFGEHQHHLVGRIEAGRVSVLYPLLKEFIEKSISLSDFRTHFSGYKAVHEDIVKKKEKFSKALSVNPELLEIWDFYLGELERRALEDSEKGMAYLKREFSLTIEYNARLISSVFLSKRK